jgi:putative DNA methylase
MNDEKSFIEIQFPVSKVSKESYKERKAGSSQVLTGLGKWWGRKPLTLVRATILGLLLPATSSPAKDREIFLKLLMMDDVGLKARKDKNISIKELYNFSNEEIRIKYFKLDGETVKYKTGISLSQKSELQDLVFDNMSYDDKLRYCSRIEDYAKLTQEDWHEINNHLNTGADSFQSLIKELGIKKFGNVPSIGDSFSGGGSIPFEAARMGLETFASDLNPLAGLLTWSSLNILNMTDKQVEELKIFQEKVFDEVTKQIDLWGLEFNDRGWRAKYYLYCNEVVCPECACKVPLLSNRVISHKQKVISELEFNEKLHNFNIKISSNVSNDKLKEAATSGTVKNNKLICPNCFQETSIASLRKDKKDTDGTTLYGLRKWSNDDIVSGETDVFHERLYCIRYIEKNEEKSWEEVIKKPAPATDSSFGKVHYSAPAEKELEMERKILSLVEEKFFKWQEEGFLPNSMIEEGDKTDEPIRTRGWAYWHHLFNPRQLLINGLFLEKINEFARTKEEKIIGLLGFNKCLDRMSRLTMWHSHRDEGEATFSNQALNPLFLYSSRSLSTLYNSWILNIKNSPFKQDSSVVLDDASNVKFKADLWITDPPYADAVSYHELSEYFLVWNKRILKDAFPNWYSDSKRIMAVKGVGETFNQRMIEVYKNLANNMSENGLQVVMFTHQDVRVWAELSLILWSAGLQVSAAWNISTETESGGLKEGNYVKGTVLLVLRKQTSEETAYLDELYPDIEEEVKYQINSMRNLDDKEEPNFSDADYLLAAYAASLKILTSYKKIEDIDVQYELSKPRTSNEESPIVKIIQEAVKIAYDYLIPSEFDNFIWKTLSPEERFYLKGLELEKNNIYQLAAYQELARGFGVSDYKDVLQNTKANNVRLRTASEFAMKSLNDNSKFGSSLLRNILVALYLSVKENDAAKGQAWLRKEYDDYWNLRTKIMEILSYIETLGRIENIGNWSKDAHAALLLKERIDNDGV